MIDKHPQADRILVAQLTGEARHRARWRELTADEEAAAVAELRVANLCRKAGADPRRYRPGSRRAAAGPGT